MKLKEKILKEIVRVADKVAPNAEIFLFGSRARGNAGRNSDWDLLMLIDKTKISFDFEKKLLNEFYDLEIETGAIFSLLIYSKKDWENHKNTSLYKNINNDRVRIK